jgi:hypothetical protein
MAVRLTITPHKRADSLKIQRERAPDLGGFLDNQTDRRT